MTSSSSSKPGSGEHRAFGGPIGALFMMVLLPVLSVYLWVCVHRHGGAFVLPGRQLLSELPVPTASSAFWVVAWVAFQVALDFYLPGRAYTGLPQKNGKRLTYRLNGLFSLIVTLAIVGALVATGRLSGTAVVEELGPLLVTAIVFAYLFSAFLYVYGRRLEPPKVDTESLVANATPSPDGTITATPAIGIDQVVYDYFMGTALNPRVGRVDLKMCFESKIGMTTWLVLTLLMAHAEWEQTGAVSLPMTLVCVFQAIYVFDFFWFEEAMLSTWDINYENYGFMLAFGFIVWMPFNFSLQAQYLVHADPEIPVWAAVLLFVMNLAGYYVFRSSNLQKHGFRTKSGAKIWGKEPEYIQTARGTKLLASGWWGLARHANYLGDLTMALAWCLACGFGHLVPYFYFLYFAPLLIDRERRDDQHCADKYGADWEKYRAKVPYRIVPFVY